MLAVILAGLASCVVGRSPELPHGPPQRRNHSAGMTTTAATFPPAPKAGPNTTITVRTTLGEVRGLRLRVRAGLRDHREVAVDVFRGIPFAASTAGANRWRPPQPRAPWAPAVLDATQNGAGCQQPHHNLDVPCDGKDGPRCQSEDCLNVNVFCPARTLGEPGPYPVLIWFHGGSFDEGSNRGPLDMYDGAYMAGRGRVCVVGANYRLGVLGAMVTWEQEGDGGNRGNQGLKDQRQAMVWAKREIAAFGGDASRVTLWGESAGAMSVGLHLVSPGSAGLFDRAIMESNVAGFQYQAWDAQEATFGQAFKKASNCSIKGNPTAVLACLRALPAKLAIRIGENVAGKTGPAIIDRILEGGRPEDALAMQWAPVVDGVEILDQPIKMWEAGDFHKGVSVLLGTNQDEAATFVYDGIPKLPEALFEPLMRAIFGKDGPKVVEFYAHLERNWTDARDSLSEVLTDYWFKCSAGRIAGAVAAGGGNAYVYRYDHLDSFSAIFATVGGLPEICITRVCHATELPFSFHNVALNYTFTPAEAALSDAVVEYWSAFASTGDPNPELDPADARASEATSWPAFNRSSRQNLRLAIPISVESTKGLQPGGLATPGVCEFFDNVVGYNH